MNGQVQRLNLSADGLRAMTMHEHFSHGVVRYGQGQYLHSAIHTNTIAGFWSVVKGDIVRTFHKVSAKHLPLYVYEFELSYNNRKNADIFGAAIRGC